MEVTTNLIKHLTNDNNLLGEGKNRGTYEVNGRVFKKTFSKFDSCLNKNEYELYTKTKAPFLSEIKDISKDGRIIEVEKCKPIDCFLEELGLSLKSIDMYDGDIDWLTNNCSVLKFLMKGYSWDDVYKFIEENNLDYKEFMWINNWMINSKGKLVCTDYADLKEEIKVA